VADNNDDDRLGSRRAAGPRARGQSPDRDESKMVMIPPPELLGIKAPERDVPVRPAVTDARTSNGHAWHSMPAPRADGRRAERAETTDLTLDSELDSDRFGPVPAPAEELAPPRAIERKSTDTWRPVRSALPELSGVR
jgi:hypothetical protein